MIDAKRLNAASGDNGSVLFVPSLIAALIALSGMTWALHLGVDPDPFATSSAAAIAVGLVVFTLIAVAGVLLVRARWVRGLAIALVAVGLGIGVITGFDVWAYVAATFSFAAMIGLLGPWLDVWLRRRPTADGPGTRPTILVLATLAITPLVGFAAPEGLATAHIVLAVTAIVLAWAYVRAWLWGLWGLRVVLPFLGIWAASSSPWPGAVPIALWVAAVVLLAWSGEAARALAGPPPPLPTPRPRRSPSGSPEERGGIS